MYVSRAFMYKLKYLRNSLVATHEDLGIILVKSTLIVTNCWHVLDDHSVIRVLARTVQDSVRLDHIVNDVRLGDLLGTELLVRAEILAVIVTKMVIAGNGSKLDTSVDQEINKSRLHLGLSRLEVITTDESTMLLGELDSTWNESILWRSVDEGNTFKNRCNSKDGRWGDLLVSVFDSLEQILGSVVHTIDEVRKTLGVGSPLNNDLIQIVVGLELTNLPLDTNSISNENELTECPCEFAQHGHCKPCCLEGHCRHDPLGWQQ